MQLKSHVQHGDGSPTENGETDYKRRDERGQQKKLCVCVTSQNGGWSAIGIRADSNAWVHKQPTNPNPIRMPSQCPFGLLTHTKCTFKHTTAIDSANNPRPRSSGKESIGDRKATATWRMINPRRLSTGKQTIVCVVVGFF